MIEKTRADVVEFNRLNSIINLEGMPFDMVMNLIVGFLSDSLHGVLVECDLIVDVGVLSSIENFLNTACLALTHGSMTEELLGARVNLWNLHDAQIEGSDAKRLARVVVCGLYDEDSSEYVIYGSELMFETFFSVLLDLNQKCCRLFSDYVIEKLHIGRKPI